MTIPMTPMKRDPLGRNIKEEYFGWTNDLIRDDVNKKTLPYSILMAQIQNDSNIGGVIRNANAFGAKEVFYYGKKSIDRRGSCGSYHYSTVKYLKTLEELMALRDEFIFIALEICPGRSIKLQDFIWPKNKKILLVLGEEGPGITAEMLELCEFVVEIEMMGTIRSLNAATASGIAMFDYMTKFNKV